MCRLLLVVDDSEQKLLPLVSARRQNKRGQLFGLSKGERLHGFGVAWLTGRAAGAVVTTRPPSDDLNVRRVLGATSSRLALAFIRSCACDRCPATTYCPASDANAQPFVRGGAPFRFAGPGFLEASGAVPAAAGQRVPVGDPARREESPTRRRATRGAKTWSQP